MVSIREIRQRLAAGGAGGTGAGGATGVAGTAGRTGAAGLSDAELLAIILREGVGPLNALELADRMLAEFPGGLAEIAGADFARLRQAAGCGTTRAVSIAAAAEFARRVAASQAAAGAARVDIITTLDDVARIFAPLAELPHEEFWALFLTSGGRVIDRVRLSQGGVAGTVVDHKLVVKRAVELLASSLILVHNHPSGVAAPSDHDHETTARVRAAAALFDINLVDHVIVSKSGSYSFAENGG